MDFKEYEEACDRTTHDPKLYPGRNTGEGVNYAIVGLCGEAGEVAGAYKKVLVSGSPDIADRDAVLDECGDVLWYLAAIARELGTTLEEVAHRNIEKCLGRYPDKTKTVVVPLPPGPFRTRDQVMEMIDRLFPGAGGLPVAFIELYANQLGSPPAATGMITRTLGVCGGRAAIAGTRIPIWLLASLRDEGATDHTILAGYGLTPAQLAAAWRYVAENRPEIDRDMAEQDDGTTPGPDHPQR